MTIAANLVRRCGAAVTVAGAATIAARSLRRANHRIDDELDRLDAEFRTSLRIQLETARRHDRRFTLTSTPIDGIARLLPTDVGRHVRVLDAVTSTDDALIVLWWNTDRQGTLAAIERLVAEGVVPRAAADATGIATFPTDGLTVVSLFGAIRDRAVNGATQPVEAVPDRAAADRKSASAPVDGRRLEAVAQA